MTTKEAVKHTPGPWTYQNFGDFGGVLTIIGSDGQGFAKTVGLRGGVDEANARLIAAAPQMLEALKMIARNGIALTDKGRDQVVQVRAVIAKAEGRS